MHCSVDRSYSRLGLPKIESIRPGGTLCTTFAQYPLPELLLGILRGNLTGRLDVAIHPEPRNHVFFKNGVPIGVELTDIHVSLVKMLIDEGTMSEAKGFELLRRAEADGSDESALLLQDGSLPAGKLLELESARARAQLVRLFDVGSVEFSFVEGAIRPPGRRLTILQPLPIVYEAFCKMKDREVVQRVLGEGRGQAFVLAATYPQGVDPFEWGGDVELAVISMQGVPKSVGDLVREGLDEPRAAAAIASLLLAGMLDRAEARPVRPEGAASPSSGRTPSGELRVRPPIQPRPVPAAAERPAVDEPTGLVIHYKSGQRAKASNEPPSSSPAARPLEPPPEKATSSEYEEIRARLGQYEGKTYYQILRVAPGTDLGQIERAYRFLVRRPEGGEADASAARALKGLFHEAFECLSDPERAKRYRALVERGETSKSAFREREVLETEAKVERAFRSMGEGRLANARALLEWAKRLSPMRTDIAVFLELLQHMEAPSTADVLSIATTLVGERQKSPEDPRIKLAYAYCLALDGEKGAARSIVDTVADLEHPMRKRVVSLLDS